MTDAAPEVMADLATLHTCWMAKQQQNEGPGDSIPTDLSLLLTFEHEGERLKPDEIDYIATYVSRGLESPTSGKYRPELCDYLLRPAVRAALHELTKDAVRRFQINAPKLVRELANILEANIADVVKSGPGGLTVRDLDRLPRNVTAAIHEIHETKNAQGHPQLRIVMYDKLAAIDKLARLLGLNKEKEAAPVVLEIGERLARALARVEREAKAIEGEVVRDGP